jgi:hypothetical protein
MNFKSQISLARFYLKHKILSSDIVSIFRRIKRRSALKKKYFLIYNALHKEGFYILENYLNASECYEAKEQLHRVFRTRKDLIQKKEDMRLFGVEYSVEAASWLKNDILMSELAEIVNGEPSNSFFVLGGYLKAGNNGSSGGGWHRDAFVSQLKGMVYLDEVTEENGPFEYVPGSQAFDAVFKLSGRKDFHFLKDRFSDEEMDSILKNMKLTTKKITGQMGTLVIFNSTGLHRGSPIQDGERNTLTSYIFPSRLSGSLLEKQFQPLLGRKNVR